MSNTETFHIQWVSDEFDPDGRNTNGVTFAADAAERDRLVADMKSHGLRVVHISSSRSA